MKKLKTFPKEDQERKQLEEIAHLYFSSPAPSSKAPEEGEKRGRRCEPFSPFPRALFVRCAAGEPERALSTWFMFNLAVMLKILSGPVLLIGSPGVYKKRFHFGFRPDRERLRGDQGLRIRSGSFGPMGVCLLDDRALWRGLGDQGQAFPVDPAAGRRVAFRYILSDEIRSGGVFGSLPSLVVFLVTPNTTTPALLDEAMGEEDALMPGHVGIVVAGAGCTEEAEALYLYWRDRIEARCDRELAVENFGALSASLSGSGMPGVGILEDPESTQTKFCQAAAALIRTKRSELVHDNS